MKIVVDTNVVAYLLLGTETFVDEARLALRTAANLLAPAHWEAELTNVLWMAVRSGIVSPEEGPMRLSLAASSLIGTAFTYRTSDSAAGAFATRAECGKRIAVCLT